MAPNFQQTPRSYTANVVRRLRRRAVRTRTINLGDVPAVFPPVDVVQGAGKGGGKRFMSRFASTNRVGVGIDPVSSLASAVIAPKGRAVKPEDYDEIPLSRRGREGRLESRASPEMASRPKHRSSARASGQASPEMTDVEDLK